MKINLNIKTVLAVVIAAGVIAVSYDVYFNFKAMKDELSAEKAKSEKFYNDNLHAIDSVIHRSQEHIAAFGLKYDSIERINDILIKKRNYDKVRYINKLKEVKCFNDSTRNRYIDSLNTFLAR